MVPPVMALFRTPTSNHCVKMSTAASLGVLSSARGAEVKEAARSRPVEHDLSRLPRAHRLERLQVLLGGESMRQDRPHVEAAREHGAHLVPGLEHLAAVDALEDEALEDDLVHVEGDLAGRDAED